MTINVVTTKQGKFKVLVNYIQRGIEYTSKDMAEHEAVLIKEQYKR